MFMDSVYDIDTIHYGYTCGNASYTQMIVIHREMPPSNPNSYLFSEVLRTNRTTLWKSNVVGQLIALRTFGLFTFTATPTSVSCWCFKGLLLNQPRNIFFSFSYFFPRWIWKNYAKNGDKQTAWNSINFAVNCDIFAFFEQRAKNWTNFAVNSDIFG